jgi:hypothetical protein
MLQELAGRIERAGLPGMPDARLLPVLPPLTSLFPWNGLRRGTTVAVPDSTSLLLALLAGPSQAGSWSAIVGLSSLGAVAAAEMGIALDRLALVPEPGPQWPVVVAALLDSLDLVVVAPPERVCDSEGRVPRHAREDGSPVRFAVEVALRRSAQLALLLSLLLLVAEDRPVAFLM